MENASTTSSDDMDTTHQPYFASFQLKSQSLSLRRGNEKKRKKEFIVENDTITSIQQNGHKNRRRSSFLSVSSSMTSRSRVCLRARYALFTSPPPFCAMGEKGQLCVLDRHYAGTA